jgi:hypothetical protein
VPKASVITPDRTKFYYEGPYLHVIIDEGSLIINKWVDTANGVEGHSCFAQGQWVDYSVYRPIVAIDEPKLCSCSKES